MPFDTDPPVSVKTLLRAKVVETTNNDELLAAETIDGVAIVEGDQVLLVGQTLPRENGLYTVGGGGLTRATPANTAAEMEAGILVQIRNGTVGTGKIYQLDTAAPITLGTTDLVFSDVTSDPPAYVEASFRSAAPPVAITIANTTPDTTPPTGIPLAGQILDDNRLLIKDDDSGKQITRDDVPTNS